MQSEILKYDLIVIGAGPAGMSAAQVAAISGLHVLILDEQPCAGGQIYRNATQKRLGMEYLGADYFKGAALVESLEHPQITTKFSASIWKIEDTGEVFYTIKGQIETSLGQYVIIANGAQERPCPFPGWTLPGVMTCGAAQIMIKTSGLIPANAVLAGSGPLIYQLAAQMIRAGNAPIALVETQSRMVDLRAMWHALTAFRGWKTLAKGAGLLAEIRKAGVKRYYRASNFKAFKEDDELLGLEFKSGDISHTLKCQTLLVHQGIIPSTHLTRSVGVKHIWNTAQRAWQPEVNIWGRTNLDCILVAGDGSGIGGVEVALEQGHLASLEVLHLTGHISESERNKRAKPSLRKLRTARAPRALLDAIYEVPKELRIPDDDTIVCRCEEVSTKTIRENIDLGASGLRQMKTACRAGMGQCQGRMCDVTVSEIIADHLNQDVSSLGHQRARSPVKPVTLGELAAFFPEQQNEV